MPEYLKIAQKYLRKCHPDSASSLQKSRCSSPGLPNSGQTRKLHSGRRMRNLQQSSQGKTAGRTSVVSPQTYREQMNPTVHISMHMKNFLNNKYINSTLSKICFFFHCDKYSLWMKQKLPDDKIRCLFTLIKRLEIVLGWLYSYKIYTNSDVKYRN